MHIAFVIHVYGIYETPKKMLDAFFTTTDWTNALCQQGVQVSVFYRYNSDEFITINNVNYYFIKDNLPRTLRHWHQAKTFNQKVVEIIKSQAIDLIHAHNPYGILANAHLRKLSRGIPMLIQDHSGKVKVKYPYILRRFLKDIDALVFAAKGQEKDWLSNDILSSEKYFFIMENSSHFKWEDRISARKKTEMAGQYVFLWVGNLNTNKDPFTALAAFEKVSQLYPEAKLYIVYRLNDLEEEVQAFIQERPSLINNVILLGAKRREELENYYNSADFFISASYKEGSGYSMVEAMSCGVIPIVTDIPSFRSLTKNGKVGALYPPGNPELLFEEICKLLNQSIEDESEKVLVHFKQHFSFEAIAKQMIEVYETLLKKSL